MFPNLKAEMARYGITNKMIAEAIGKSESWVENRICGKATMPVTIAMKIKGQFFPKIPLEKLFSQASGEKKVV